MLERRQPRRFVGNDLGDQPLHRWRFSPVLENVVARAATLAKGMSLTQADLSIDATVGRGSNVRPTLAELERDYIDRILTETHGDKNAAAKILGISVRTLQRMFRDPRDELQD